MSRFFIDRPIFAWVIALVIMLVGALSILKLPINQYPSIAPPAIAIQVTYPGASAQTVQDTVVQVIEQQLNGIDNLRYVSSESNSDGSMTITATFEQGTNSDTAQVQVQNKLNLATPLLPQEVQQQGIRVTKAVKNFLMVIGVVSRDGSMTKDDLSNYIVSNMQDPISRTAGVGDFQVFGAQYAMRIWLDPAKLNNFNLTPGDVKTAIAAQNVQVSSGQLGGLPAVAGQQLNATIIGKTRLQTAEQFKAILLKVNKDGSQVRVGDVADVGLGGENYSISAQFNGSPASGLAVKLANGANALDTAKALRKTIESLKPFFPQGMEVVFPYDTTPVVTESIKGVVETLVEAIVLVFLVMFLFLQNFRATVITTMTVPVVLLGTFGILAAFGFSINTLTMFGMVLAIGLLVDDAIVVVENVERNMAMHHIGPKEAAIRAMQEVSGPVIAVVLVLSAVFIPAAFLPGTTGQLYKQFAVTLVVSVIISGFVALTLTPAMASLMLKHTEPKTRGFFGWFNRRFERLSDSYQGGVTYALKRTGRYLLIYLALLAIMALLFSRLPSSFLPVEDQGYTITDIQLPPGASQNRTIKVVEQIEAHNASEPGVGDSTIILGFSFSGNGQNAALAFTTLKDWSQRGSEDSAMSIADRANAALGAIKDAVVYAVLPPPIDGLGTSSGFEFRLQDRGGVGHAALMQARDELLKATEKSPILANVRESALAEAPQVQLEVDRKQANALGVSFADIGSLLSTALGSSYVNDFPNQGRMQRVVIQAEGDQRSQVEDLLRLNVRNSAGKMVPLSAFVRASWSLGPAQLTRYNGYPAIAVSGEPAPGHSTGEAMQEIERLVAQLPTGLGLEWTGLSLQERLSGSQAPMLLGLSLLIVFLCLAALYESWSIPTSVLLVVPLGVLGAVLAVSLRGMPNDVFFKVGLITIIGLSAKNAILIIEFAKSLYDEGHDLIDATVQAARLRLRPIVMTSLAFILGVVPLAIATGASSASQQAIGTGVIGGMITATLAVIFVPVFFVVVMKLVKRGSSKD